MEVEFVWSFCGVFVFFFNFSILFLLICAKSNTWLSHWLKKWFIQVLVSYPFSEALFKTSSHVQNISNSHLGKMQYFWCWQDPGILKKCEYFIALFGCQLCLFECTTSASGVLRHCEYIIAVTIFFRLPLHSMRRLNKRDK